MCQRSWTSSTFSLISRRDAEATFLSQEPHSPVYKAALSLSMKSSAPACRYMTQNPRLFINLSQWQVRCIYVQRRFVIHWQLTTTQPSTQQLNTHSTRMETFSDTCRIKTVNDSPRPAVSVLCKLVCLLLTDTVTVQDVHVLYRRWHRKNYC